MREIQKLEPALLAETPQWWVVGKPAGWLTIPGRDPAPVLVDWLRKRQGGEVLVVHRIDRETSGLVLFARTAEAHRQACLWFQHHEVKKAYDCLAAGVPDAPVLKLREPIAGAASFTQVECKERFGAGAFLGRAVPLSGRRHQIRIHLAGQGHAILGDARYGGRRELDGRSFDRVALHARELALPSGERFECAWPEDFARWVSELRR